MSVCVFVCVGGGGGGGGTLCDNIQPLEPADWYRREFCLKCCGSPKFLLYIPLNF